MKTIKFLSTIVLAVICTACVYSRNNAHYVDDPATEVKVKAALIASKNTPSKHVAVKSTNGHVELLGFIDKSSDRYYMKRITKKQDGVRKIDTDHLVVK